MTIDKNVLAGKPAIVYFTISVETELENVSDCMRDVLEKIEKWSLLVDLEDVKIATEGC